MGNLTQERETGFLLNVGKGKSQSNAHDTQQLENTKCRSRAEEGGKKMKLINLIRKRKKN